MYLEIERKYTFRTIVGLEEEVRGGYSRSWA